MVFAFEELLGLPLPKATDQPPADWLSSDRMPAISGQQYFNHGDSSGLGSLWDADSAVSIEYVRILQSIWLTLFPAQSGTRQELRAPAQRSFPCRLGTPIGDLSPAADGISAAVAAFDCGQDFATFPRPIRPG